jgi:fibro-slime domain-containing protein
MFARARVVVFVVVAAAAAGCVGTSGPSSGRTADGGSDSGLPPDAPTCVGTCPELNAQCGNGVFDATEACDDGNNESGDGCSFDCKVVEEGFGCPETGSACVPTASCGDGMISGTETCDDHNAVAGDGCDANCQLEAGWACPTVGATCRASACGDGVIAGAETCEDGNPTPTSGDGCSERCQLESAAEGGWVCATPGQPCVRSVCPNGIREGSEQCDDGNHDMGDGCTPFCKREPSCPTTGGACSSSCGDGIRLGNDDEPCEDGNTQSGDGCSAQCDVEPGYVCSPANSSGSTLTLPLVLRDFRGRVNSPSCWSSTTAGPSAGATPDPAACGHPDFQYKVAAEQGIAAATLGADGKPTYGFGPGTSTTTNGASYFNQWYRDVSGVNTAILRSMTLNKLQTGEFQFHDAAFFPLNNLGFGNQGYTDGSGNSRNFHFTSEVRYWFEYKGGEHLQFTGDDDVFVYINKKLVIDLGGVHGAITGSVTLNSTTASQLGLEVGKVYEIVVFQAERHTVQSNYRLTLGNFNNAVTACQSVCGDGIRTPDEACDNGAAQNTGAYGGCNANCTWAPRCGDGVVQAAEGEQCDNASNLTPYGTTGCAPSCKTPARCGDGKVDALFGETCDDANDVNDDYCDNTCQQTFQVITI